MQQKILAKNNFSKKSACTDYKKNFSLKNTFFTAIFLVIDRFDQTLNQNLSFYLFFDHNAYYYQICEKSAIYKINSVIVTKAHIAVYTDMRYLT